MVKAWGTAAFRTDSTEGFVGKGRNSFVVSRAPDLFAEDPRFSPQHFPLKGSQVEDNMKYHSLGHLEVLLPVRAEY